MGFVGQDGAFSENRGVQMGFVGQGGVFSENRGVEMGFVSQVHLIVD
ncbi:hypothetical protein [Robertmurraya sp. Marseille-Q9965]